MHRPGLEICISMGVILFFIIISLQCFCFICLSKMSHNSMQDLASVISLIHCKMEVSIRKTVRVHSSGSAVAAEGLIVLSLGTVHQTFITETSCILCSQLLASAGEMLTPHELTSSEFQVQSCERPIPTCLEWAAAANFDVCVASWYSQILVSKDWRSWLS